MGTFWADVSQYQNRVIDDSYPHNVFCFRTNSGDQQDTLALENARRAKAMLDSGKLTIVIAYYFFWPGQANCDLHKRVLEQAGLWRHAALVTMVDVEDANRRISGDHSTEINDEVKRLQGWYGNPVRVIGYLNAVSNPDLWTNRPGIRFVTPNYETQKPWDLRGVPDWMLREKFAHQYSDRVPCAPFGPCDANYTDLDIASLKTLFGITQGVPAMSEVDQINKFTAGFNGPIGTDVKDIREQLCGLGGRDTTQYPGWPQLGGRTVVDAIAAIGAKLGIDGFYDPRKSK